MYRGNGVRGNKKQRANKPESTILVIHFGRHWSRIASGTIWQRGSQSGRTAPNHLADEFEVVNESSCLPGQL